MADETDAPSESVAVQSAEQFNKELLERVNALIEHLRAQSDALPPDYLTAVALTTVGAAMSRDLDASVDDVTSQVQHVFMNEFRVLTPVPDESTN